ncbi:MAG TPA: hypothetical protein VHE30_20895 [Polyangiaceae bacterium]|nr:hypothetical protein [Polyangiaceae bacterium]
MDSAVALAPLAHLGAYAALLALSTYCVLRAAARRALADARPYQPGLYLFPAGVFDARSDPLRVFRHPELRAIDVAGTVIRVRAEGAAFEIRVPDASTADQVRAALESGRQQLEHAQRTANQREQAMLDPLVDSGFSSPFSPQVRLFRQEPMWAKLALPIALVLGVLLGGATWKLRNTLSERRLYIAATARDDVAAYRQYLARGGKRADVPQILLPRAELRLAVKEGTVEALERFSDEHPGTAIAAEVDIARNAAVQKELDEAKAVGTVSALRAMKAKRSRYPFVAPAVDREIVALYKDALKRFSEGKSPATVSLFERLLGYSKESGPAVHVEFVRRMPESVDAADGQVKRSGYYMGKQSIPSQYFQGDYAEKREQALWEKIAKALEEPFSRDMIDVLPKELVTEPKTDAGPAIVIDYAPEMAGGFMSPKPRGVFVGVGMTFKATITIPGDPTPPLEVKSQQWRAPNPLILQREGTTVADVYESMAKDGFDKFEKSFLPILTGKP